MPYFRLLAICSLPWLIGACGGRQTLPVRDYYAYDQNFPLQDSLRLESETDAYRLYYLTYQSVHDVAVTGLYSVPKPDSLPRPVVILLHGIKDNKRVDYVENGHRHFLDAGYAVLRIDIANHGDRKRYAHKYDFAGGYRYWTRDVLAQTVFDLRRAVDFLQSRPEIDPERIGFVGISLGGVIGAVFCGVEDRVKVPALALAGGGLHLIMAWKAYTDDTQTFFSIIDPLNFVERISPRPLLMLNAEHDEVVPPLTTRALYNKAGNPKKIIWYPATHRQVPQDEIFQECVRWFASYL